MNPQIKRHPFEKYPKLAEHLEFAANNWTVDTVHWNVLLEEINNVVSGAEYGYNIKESVDVEMSKNIEIVLPSATSACKYNVQVKSMVGEVLFEHTFYGDSKPLIKQQKQE
mgnify:CR=1 FL=1